jgi:hypothetical protein
VSDAASVLLDKYKEHRTQARQHETLRSTLVTITGAASGAVLSLSGAQGADPHFKLAAAVFLVMIGVFAAIMAYKHYERFRYHTTLAKEFDKRLISLSHDIVNLENYDELMEKHSKRFGWIVEARAHVGWIAFPGLIAVLGAALVVAQLRAL